MRIVWLSYCFGEYNIRHANALAKEHEVLVVLVTDEAVEQCRQLDPAVKVFACPTPRLRQPLSQLSLARTIVKRIEKFQPDVVHYQNGHLWFNFALPFLRRYPLVITVHDPRHHAGDRVSKKTPQFVMDFGFRQADQVIVHGKQLIDVLTEEIGISADRVHAIPHIDLTNRCEITGDSSEEQSTVLFFGRIWEYKGLEYLIKAEPLISAQIPGVRIVIAGEGEDFATYRDMMQNLAHFEVHNSWISGEQRAEFFRRAAVVVLPYTEATQSGVVPIAYAFGKPVVASRVGALPEAVRDGVTGLLVPPRDVEALAHAVVQLLSNPELRQSMGQNGKQYLHTECAPEVVAEKTAYVYEQAIDCRNQVVRNGAFHSRTGRHFKQHVSN